MSITQKILYHTVRGSLKCLAVLPLPVLYVAADFIAFLLGKIVRYRRRVILKNLTACFPDKSERERLDILNEFYHNLADYIVESVKLLHISDKEMLKRFEFSGLEHITDAMNQGRSVVSYFSHCFNWEWAPSITLRCSEQVAKGNAFCQIYRPLRNAIFDRLMLEIRSRFGSVSIPKEHSLRRFIEMRRDGVVSVTGFMSDQKPSHGDTDYAITFLNRPTLVITGTETLARRLGMTVVYWDMEKTARGHYRINIIPMADNAAETEQHQLTNQYFTLLESTIRRNPAIWLWSHNRWKHMPKTAPTAL